MNENSKRETRDKLIMEALIARRLATEQQMGKIAAELDSLKQQEMILVEEIKLLDEILGAVPSAPAPRPKMEPEQVHTILSPPIPSTPLTEEPAAASQQQQVVDVKKRRKGLRRGELADVLRQRFGDKEFSLEQVVDILLETEPGERRKAYHAAWRTANLLEEAKILEVVSETPSGKGVSKTYKIKTAEG